MGKSTDFAGIIQKKSRVVDLGWLFRLLEKTKKLISLTDDFSVTPMCALRRTDGMVQLIFMGAMNVYSVVISELNDFFCGLKTLPIRMWQNIKETIIIRCVIRASFTDKKPETFARARVRMVKSVIFSVIEDLFKMPISVQSHLSCYPSRAKMNRKIVNGCTLRASKALNAVKLHREDVSGDEKGNLIVESRGRFHGHFE